MPQYGSKKRKFKKTRYSSSSSSSSSSNKILRSTVFTAETKCQDYSNVLSFSPAGNIVLLNGLLQGTDVRQHVGRRSCIKGFYLRGLIQQQGAGAGEAQMLRILLVYDRQPNAAAATVGDILQDTDTPGYTNMSFMNINNTKRFLVLGSHKWVQCREAVGSNQELANNIVETTPRFVDMAVPYKKLRGLVTEYTGGSTATISDITTGAIWLVVIGANANEYQFQFKARYRFCDL